MSRWKGLLIGVALLILILAGGNLGLEDERNQERHYAKMVCDGHWPDYMALFPVCKTETRTPDDD